MPRAGFTHTLVADTADSYQRIAPSSETTITFEKDCVAVILAAETAAVFVQFDGTAASATNGVPITAGAQPCYIPLGRFSNSAAALRAFSATGVLHCLQLA